MGSTMGLRRNFSRGSNVDISLILFQVANDAMQMDLQKTLSTLLIPRRTFPMKGRTPFAFFEIGWRWSCTRVCEKVVLFVILCSFCWIGLSSNVIIIVNCRQLSPNWSWTIHNYACGAHISLCGLNLTSQNLVWNVFYTLAIRNAFSFLKLLAHFLKKVIISE